MGLNKWGIGCDCCGCSIDLEFRNICSSSVLVPTTSYTVKDGGGSTITSGTTDSSGEVTVSIPSAATYTVVPSKTGYFGGEFTINAVCGGTYVVPINTNAWTFSVRSCNFALPGAIITISGPQPQTLTTGAGGSARWVPGKTGSYAYTVTHPSDRFQPYGGSLTVNTAGLCNGFPPTINLVNKSGYSCCLSNSTYPLPHKSTLIATTSDGETFNVVTCGFNDCIPSDTVRIGGLYTQTSCPGGGGINNPPGDLGDGKVNVLVTISLSSMVGTCKLRWCQVRMDNPQGELDCAYKNSPLRHYEQWFVDASCPQLKSGNPPGNSSVIAGMPETYGTITINNLDPFSITFSFPSSWNVGYSYDDPPDPPAYLPIPISYITVVEP